MANGTGNDGDRPPDSAFSIVNTLTLIVVIGYLTFMPLWMFFPPQAVDAQTLAIINQMMGSWGYAFAAVVGYHIGSSKTSRQKDETISKMATTTPGTVAAAAAAEVIKKDDSEAAWAILKTSGDAEALRKFISDFPGSQHKAEAEAIIAGLKPKE